MMLAGAKAIAARAQPLGKDTMFNKFLISNVFLKKIYLSNKAQSTILHMFTKEKKFPDKRGGRPPSNPLSLAVPTVDTAPLNNIPSNLFVGQS